MKLTLAARRRGFGATTMRPWPLFAAALLLLLGSQGVSLGFSLDSHFYLTFAGALDTCFNWEEAHIIASANRRLDGQKATKAEANITKKYAKINWHAFGQSGARLTELWYRALDEPDPTLQLVYFGQFLHFLQDWESHAGFPTGIGHARASFIGKDPDSWARAEQRTERMLRAHGEHLVRFCYEIGRPIDGNPGPEEALTELALKMIEDGLLEDIVAVSSPRWKFRKPGGFTKKGKRILAQNAGRIEEYIEQHLKPDPEKGIPDDFRANDPDHGLPRALDLAYDRDGNVVSGRDELEEAGTAGDPEDEHDADLEVRIHRGRQKTDGWQVVIEVENIGDRLSARARMTVAALDPMAEEILGETSADVPALAPGSGTRLDVMVMTSRPSDEVMIEAFLDAQDPAQSNNEAWFMTKDDAADLAEDLEEIWAERQTEDDIDPGDLEEYGDPKVWLASDDSLCVVVWARLDDEDPTEEMNSPTFLLADAAGNTLPLEARDIFMSDIWNITVLGRSEPPGLLAWACFDTKSTLCTERATGFEPTAAPIVISAEDVEITEEIALDDLTRARLQALCP